MQNTHMNENSRTLVLVPPGKKIYSYSSAGDANQPNSILTFVLNISFVAVLVRCIRITKQILSFIISLLNRVTVTPKQVANQSTTIAIKEEKPQSSSVAVVSQEYELKDHFLTMASHELKTPMTTIVGQTQLMLRRLSKMSNLPSEMAYMRSALESIDGQTRRLNTLVDDLLDTYNIRSGKVTLRFRTCDLVDLCHEATEEQATLTGRTIELDAPQNSVVLCADPDRLYQVIVNLLGNAIKYSPEDSPVKVHVYQSRDIGVIEVQDSGSGIPMELQSRIFEPFYRGPDVEVSPKSGMGLGLTICKEIVERHSGRIWCRSRVGKGSTFIVELPQRPKTTTRLS